MADFKRKKRFKTRVPQLKVQGNLPPGTYVFQLQVVDQNGNRSSVDKVKVRIVDNRIPVEPFDPNDFRIDRPVIGNDPVIIRRP